jgi:hypothetical protein
LEGALNEAGRRNEVQQDMASQTNRANPCRCANKTRGFMQAGGPIDPNSLLFARAHVERVHEVVRTSAEALTTLDAQYADVFRQHPFPSAA